jgi:predicted RNase H-like HicB family nuclease
MDAAPARQGWRESIRQAIQMQIAGKREDGLPIPIPSGEFIEVDAA